MFSSPPTRFLLFLGSDPASSYSLRTPSAFPFSGFKVFSAFRSSSPSSGPASSQQGTQSSPQGVSIKSRPPRHLPTGTNHSSFQEHHSATAVNQVSQVSKCLAQCVTQNPQANIIYCSLSLFQRFLSECKPPDAPCRLEILPRLHPRVSVQPAERGILHT